MINQYERLVHDRDTITNWNSHEPFFTPARMEIGGNQQDNDILRAIQLPVIQALQDKINHMADELRAMGVELHTEEDDDDEVIPL